MSPVGVLDRFGAALAGVTRWTTLVDWSNNGGHTWTPATFVDGTVTCASTSQVRWTCTLKLTDVPFGAGGLNPYQTRLRVRHGLRYSSHEQPQWLGLGRYALTSATRSLDDPDQVAVSGQSYEHYLIRSSLVGPRTVKPGSASALLATLVREVLPEAQIAWDPAVDDVALPKLVIEKDRWAMIDGGSDATSIAKSLAARVYPDENGIWRVMPVPSLQDDPVWEARPGVGGVLLTKTEQLSNDGVSNVQVVYGSPSGSAVIGPGIAKDYDPLSLTYVGRSPDAGGYGQVPADAYTSQLITTRAQAGKVAQARLASRLGLKQQLTFGTLHDPTKRPGQVGILYGFTPQRCILDSVTYDLSPAPGPLSCETRTTATRLAGDITDPSSSDDGGV